jgi:hypothetical protein
MKKELIIAGCEVTAKLFVTFLAGSLNIGEELFQ